MSLTYRTSDGLRLAYEDAGEGPAVICLPGLTRNARDFDDMGMALGPGQRLIRLTYRGRGRRRGTRISPTIRCRWRRGTWWS